MKVVQGKTSCNSIMMPFVMYCNVCIKMYNRKLVYELSDGII